MTYNAAVIGLGNIGYVFKLDPKRKGIWTHTDAYKKCGFTNLVGAVETNAGRAEIFRKGNPNIPVYGCVQELFDNHKVDAVSICVPTEKHFPVFREVIKHNIKAVFCEKPLAYAPEESKKMVNEGKRKGIVFAVNYARRWESSYCMVMAMVKKGAIGRINAVHSFYPGQIYNIGSHLFDTVLFLTGLCPVAISGIKVNMSGDPSVSGWIKCKSGAFITFSSTGRREDLIFEIDIVGDAGRLRIIDNGNGIEFFVFKESMKYSGYRELYPEKINLPPKNERFEEAISDIIGVLEGRRKNVKCPAEEALLVDRIIEKALVSAMKKGKPELI